MSDLFGNEIVKALSWKQPYLDLMLHGKVETRTWNTNYRGLVLMCASKAPYKEEVLMNISGKEQYEHIYKTINPKNAILGHALAIGRLTHCRPMRKEDEKECFVEYHPDLFCHFYIEVKRIEPIPWKGSQGWRTVPQEIVKQIQIIK